MGSTKTQETKLPQWQEDFIRENILPMGLDIANTPYTPYTGETIAPMAPLQTQALSEFGNLGVGGQTYGQAITTQGNLASFAPSSLSSADLGAYMSPYTQEVIDRGQMDIERQRQMASNTLGAQATAAGAFGGSRQGVAEGVLAGEAARAAADLSATQRQQAYDQALKAAQFDIGGELAGAGVQAQAANDLASLSLQGLGAQMTAAEQQRALEQAQLQSDYAMFQQEQGYPLTQFNALLAAGSGIPAGLGTVTQHDPFGMLSPFGSLLSGAGSLGKGAAAMGWGSDTRLKKNVKPLYKRDGIQFYSWDWNDEGKRIAHPDQPTVGVMAQELEKIHPDLVMVGDDGYRRVNYVGLSERTGA